MKAAWMALLGGGLTLALAYLLQWNAIEMMLLYIVESVIFAVFHSQRIKALPKYESSFGVTTASISKDEAAKKMITAILWFAGLSGGFIISMSFALNGYDLASFWQVTPILLLYVYDQYQDYQQALQVDTTQVRDLEGLCEVIGYKVASLFLIAFSGMLFQYRGFAAIAAFVVIATVFDVLIGSYLRSDKINSRLASASPEN